MRKLNEQELVRREKLEEISKITNPYPERYEINYSIKEASNLADETKGIKIAGRIVLMRKMGKLSFLTISDITGKIQISIKVDLIGEEKYAFFKEHFDLGDFIGIEGEMFTTHTGEKTIRANNYDFLGKALKPLPEKYHGLLDVEEKFRNRYVDLITNDDSKNKFLLRSNLIKYIRRYLEDNNYIEVETPILINKPSGALAKPFISHHNALDTDVYLRIAPETYLKRAIIGGYTKVFEFARCFRNEGIDATHLQDFTMLEAYCAYYNYEDNMVLVREMIIDVVTKLFGKTLISFGGSEVDLSKEWKKVSFKELILKDCGIDISIYDTKDSLLKEIINKGIELESSTEISLMGYGNLVDLLYKKVSRPKLKEPIFLVEHPIDLSPLARCNDKNNLITDRFQLVINGAEIINAYSELVDPIEQEKRLIEQSKLNSHGDEEAMVMDEDYINAMEYGMPPISGWGLGIDRLVQLLTDTDNIKDCVLFPLMRPLNKEEKNEKE